VELKERYGLNLVDDETDVETLGGYVFARLGRPGEVGDEVIVQNRCLRVEEMDNLRIARVSIEETSAPEGVEVSEEAEMTVG
jgi:CBS domain containing-hemolysin-like protein